MPTPRIRTPARPKFGPGGLRELTPEGLEDETIYRGRVLEGQSMHGRSLAGHPLRSVSFEGCVFRNMDLSATDWLRVRLADVRFEECSLNGAVWSEASLERVEFAECRLLGAQLPAARLRDVRLSRVQAQLSLWLLADTRTFWAENCDFGEAVFAEAGLPGAVFRDCRLPKTDFSGAALTGADFRGSDLANTRLGLRELAGVTVEAAQLTDLAHLLGVTVTEL